MSTPDGLRPGDSYETSRVDQRRGSRPLPAWVDREQYPFESRFLDLEVGRLHYVDQGQGCPLVMVHGAPTWSFLYRHVIRRLSSRFRCIAPDLMGCGLSSNPEAWSYLPRDHADLLARLLETLDLRDVILVVHDWGGPIGLSWALDQPERVRGVVLSNTWMWSVRGSLRGELTGRIFASRPWRVLERRLGLSTRIFMPSVMGNRRKLTPTIHRHYLQPFARSHQRRPNEVFWAEILGSSAWLDGLWRRRTVLREKPALILWGERDRAFTARDLARWQEILPQACTHRFPRAGHFVQEEDPEGFVRRLEEFLISLESPAAGAPR